jgi:hypothetical protein
VGRADRRWSLRDPDKGLEPDVPGAAGGAEAPADQLESPRSELRQAVSRVARELEEIVKLAERAAEEIRANAEREADRYLEERRREADLAAAGLGEVGGVLLQRVGRLNDDVEAMRAELDRAANRIRSLSVGESAAKPEPPPGPRLVDESSRAGQARAESRPATPAPPEALLRAAQLAVAGKERSEIEAALRAELAVADPAPIVDSILGND